MRLQFMVVYCPARPRASGMAARTGRLLIGSRARIVPTALGVPPHLQWLFAGGAWRCALGSRRCPISDQRGYRLSAGKSPLMRTRPRSWVRSEDVPLLRRVPVREGRALALAQRAKIL